MLRTLFCLCISGVIVPVVSKEQIVYMSSKEQRDI